MEEIKSDDLNRRGERLIGTIGTLIMFPISVIGIVRHIPSLVVIGFIFGTSGLYKMWTGSPEPLGPFSRWLCQLM